jgi:hypothetical protein
MINVAINRVRGRKKEEAKRVVIGIRVVIRVKVATAEVNGKATRATSEGDRNFLGHFSVWRSRPLVTFLSP